MTSVAVTPARAGEDPNRWRALAVIGIAQFMIILNVPIVILALSSMQADLRIVDADRQWVVTAYTLAFGSLLLLGGRIADFSGRKRMLILGFVGFALASAVGGLSSRAEMLFAARGLQGAYAAILAPAALSLITVTFTESTERAKAFGVYGALSAAGGGLGLVLGGVFAQAGSWRWCQLVNIPVAVIAILLAVRFVRESRAAGDTRYDIPGAITGTGGLFCLVFGITKAETGGWGGPTTLSFLGASGVLLCVFLCIEARTSHPLLPLKIVLDRNRGGALLSTFFVGLGSSSTSLFVSHFFVAVLQYSPLSSGLLFLPATAVGVISAVIASHMLPRLGPRLVTLIGFVLATVGCGLLLRMSPESTYSSGVLPSLLVLSAGMGLVMVPLAAVSLFGVRSHDAGVASALLNTSQQIGGSIGVALLSTIAASVTTAWVQSHSLEPAGNALVAGFESAFIWSTALLALGGLASIVLVRTSRDDMSLGMAVPAITDKQTALPTRQQACRIT